MQVSVASNRLSSHLPLHVSTRLRVAACCGLLSLIPLSAHAGDTIVVDPQLIATLELRAHQAEPREQVQLYADLADKISVLASRQIADGDIEHAQETLHKLETCTAEIEAGVQKNSKGLKRTEMLLHTTNRRLTDLVRSASGDMKPVVQAALKRLDKAQTALLSAVFEK